MRSAILTLAVACVPALLGAQQLTSAERQVLQTSLKQTNERVAKLAASLTADQWTYKPSENRWSVAEVVEHILIAEQSILGLLEAQLHSAPAPQRAGSIADSIGKFMADRSQRFQAPEQAQPTGRWASQDAVLAAWKENRAKLAAYVKSPADVHGHALPNPVFGPLDGYEWLTFLTTHTERHVMQIDEVMASAKYPSATR